MWWLSFKGKKGSFERLLEAYLRGASSLWFRITWSSRSFIFWSSFHLIHHFLNHSYPPMPLNTGSSPMGERGKNCVEHLKSFKIILELLEERWSWRKLSIGRNTQHQGIKVVVSPIIYNKKILFFSIFTVSCVCIAWFLGYKHRSSLLSCIISFFSCCIWSFTGSFAVENMKASRIVRTTFERSIMAFHSSD